MRKSKSMSKVVVIAQSFIKNGRNGDAYRYQRRFVPFKKFEKVRIYWTYQNVSFPPRHIDWNPRSPDRKRSQIARSQEKPDRINTTFIVEFCPCQIGRNPPDRQAPDRARSIKKPDRQIGTARSAPDHFRLASWPFLSDAAASHTNETPFGHWDNLPPLTVLLRSFTVWCRRLEGFA